MTPQDRAQIEALVKLAETAMPLHDRSRRDADSLALRAFYDAIPAVARLIDESPKAKEPETFELSNEGSFLDLGGFF